MPVRRLTLEEWFLAYQLRQLNKAHHYTPVLLDVDITGIAQLYLARGQKVPVVAVIIKALALTAQRAPEVNVAYFRTFYGDRLVQFDQATVNMPVLLEENGRSHLSAMSIRAADLLSIDEIRARIREAKQGKLDETTLTRLVARRKNTILMRVLLKLIHFVVFNAPATFERKGGGGLAVTALINDRPELPRFRVIPYGPAAVSVFSSGMVEQGNGRTMLQLGIGIDHCALTGWQMQKLVNTLHQVLATSDVEQLKAFG